MFTLNIKKGKACLSIIETAELLGLTHTEFVSRVYTERCEKKHPVSSSYMGGNTMFVRERVEGE